MSTMRVDNILSSGGGSNATINGITPALASQAEAEAGTDNTKLMTPLRVAQTSAWNYISTGQTFSTTATTVNHGLGVVPALFIVTLRCISNDAATGYVEGDEIPLASYMDGDGARASAIWASSTQIGVRLGSTSLVPKASGGMTAPTSTNNFQMIFKARQK